MTRNSPPELKDILDELQAETRTAAEIVAHTIERVAYAETCFEREEREWVTQRIMEALAERPHWVLQWLIESRPRLRVVRDDE